jgi:hypothetical protein
VTELLAPVCSITKTKRGRWFWAAWWTAPPTHVPFRKPDAEGGAASSREEALAAAEKRAGTKLAEIDALWAKAWMRVLRGQTPWPSKSSREPRSASVRSEPQAESVWTLLGVSPRATEAELKAAYRKKAIEAHPDHGGDAETFRRIVAAYADARRRIKRPKRKKTRA